MQYLDRHEAGGQLAAELMPFASEQPVIVALPRGGVPVGVEVARALGAPIEFLAVRKIGAPGNPELANPPGDQTGFVRPLAVSNDARNIEKHMCHACVMIRDRIHEHTKGLIDGRVIVTS